MEFNLLHRRMSHPGIHFTEVLLEGKIELGNKDKAYLSGALP
jgi:hypothetical protein